MLVFFFFFSHFLPAYLSRTAFKTKWGDDLSERLNWAWQLDFWGLLFAVSFRLLFFFLFNSQLSHFFLSFYDACMDFYILPKNASDTFLPSPFFFKSLCLVRLSFVSFLLEIFNRQLQSPFMGLNLTSTYTTKQNFASILFCSFWKNFSF